MKKFLLLIIMAACTIGMQAKTDKLYATYKSVSNSNISFGEDGKTFTIKGASNNTYQWYSFEAGTLSKYKSINFNLSTKGGAIRILFIAGSTTVKTWTLGSVGQKSVDLSTIDATALSPEKIATVTEIRIGGSQSSTDSYPYDLVVDPSTNYLETAEYENMSISTTVTSSSTKTSPFAWVKYDDATTAYDSYISNNIGKAKGVGATLFGPSNASTNAAKFLVNGYDKAVCTLTSSSDNNSIRMSNGTSYFKEIATTASTTSCEFDLSEQTQITTIKTKNATASDDNPITVSQIDFIKDFAATSTTAFNIAASVSSAVNYDRSFTAGQKSTVCLPFALTADEVSAAGTFYTLSSVDDNGLHFTEVTETEAYKPYLFVANATGTPFSNLTGKAIAATATNNTNVGDYTFQGTLAATSDVKNDNSGKTVYGWSSTNGTFVKVGSGVSCNAFRAYITTTQTGSAKLAAFFDEDTPTAIETVNNDATVSNGTCYNLAGQRVSANAKGIIIKDGKKFLVK